MKSLVKIIFTLCLTGILSTPLLAQESAIRQSDAYKRQVQVYQDALRFNDVSVAKNALYNLRAIDPTNNALLDSLAYLYFEYQQYASSLLVSREILTKNSDHLAALEIQAISFEKLGLYDKALSSFESLYLKRENPYTLYKIGMLQFDLKRHNESKTSLAILLKDPAIEELNVVVNEEENRQQQKEIPMKAALYNFQGLNNMELGNKDEAKQNFEAALELAPDYTMAKQNLEKI